MFRGVPSSTTKKVFREAFSHIGELRSFTYKVPVLALSATIEIDFTSIVNGACTLSKNVRYIYSCSDRPNIRLSIIPIKTKSTDCFRWLFKMINEHGARCPKILIYCRSQELTSWLFGQFLHILQNKIYKDNIKSHENFLVGMYHADSPSFNKDKCLKSLTADDCLPRVIVATSVVGCGINARNLKYVCHYGPAHSLVDYCQQIGRAGRNGEEEMVKMIVMLFCMCFLVVQEMLI